MSSKNHPFSVSDVFFCIFRELYDIEICNPGENGMTVDFLENAGLPVSHCFNLVELRKKDKKNVDFFLLEMFNMSIRFSFLERLAGYSKWAHVVSSTKFDTLERLEGFNYSMLPCGLELHLAFRKEDGNLVASSYMIPVPYLSRLAYRRQVNDKGIPWEPTPSSH